MNFLDNEVWPPECPLHAARLVLSDHSLLESSTFDIVEAGMS